MIDESYGYSKGVEDAESQIEDFILRYKNELSALSGRVEGNLTFKIEIKGVPAWCSRVVIEIDPSTSDASYGYDEQYQCPHIHIAPSLYAELTERGYRQHFREGVTRELTHALEDASRRDKGGSLAGSLHYDTQDKTSDFGALIYGLAPEEVRVQMAVMNTKVIRAAEDYKRHHGGDSIDPEVLLGYVSNDMRGFTTLWADIDSVRSLVKRVDPSYTDEVLADGVRYMNSLTGKETYTPKTVLRMLVSLARTALDTLQKNVPRMVYDAVERSKGVSLNESAGYASDIKAFVDEFVDWLLENGIDNSHAGGLNGFGYHGHSLREVCKAFPEWLDDDDCICFLKNLGAKGDYTPLPDGSHRIRINMDLLDAAHLGDSDVASLKGTLAHEMTHAKENIMSLRRGAPSVKTRVYDAEVCNIQRTLYRLSPAEIRAAIAAASTAAEHVVEHYVSVKGSLPAPEVVLHRVLSLYPVKNIYESIRFVFKYALNPAWQSEINKELDKVSSDLSASRGREFSHEDIKKLLRKLAYDAGKQLYKNLSKIVYNALSNYRDVKKD